MAKKPHVEEEEAQVSDGDDQLDVLELEDDLADIEKPPELPAAVYTGEVQDVQVKVSGKGNRYYAIGIKIPPDQIPADISEHYEDGATLYWNRQIVPGKRDRRALYGLRKLIEALGLDSAVKTIDPNDWMGCQVRVKVRHSKYQGEQRAEIAALEAAEAAPAARKRR